jgi:hypothetical protein
MPQRLGCRDIRTEKKQLPHHDAKGELNFWRTPQGRNGE